MDHHFSAFDNSLRAWVMYVLNRLHILVAYNDLLCMLIEEYNIVTRLVMNPIKTIKEYNRISFKHEDALYKERYLRYLENSCHSTVVAYGPL